MSKATATVRRAWNVSHPLSLAFVVPSVFPSTHRHTNRRHPLQFRALSEQLYRTEELHAEVRGRAVEQLKRHPELYAPYVEVGDGAGPSGRPLPKDFEAYRLKMAKDGEWGDHVTLQVLFLPVQKRLRSPPARGSPLASPSPVCPFSAARTGGGGLLRR